MDFLT
jgi:hypothetical protein